MSRPCFRYMDMVQFLYQHHPEFGLKGERFDYVLVPTDLSGFSFHYYRETKPLGKDHPMTEQMTAPFSSHNIQVRWEDAQELFEMLQSTHKLTDMYGG